MSSDSVLHRRNKQIQDAIDSRNYKQALQLVDKRLKKGEDSRFLRVRGNLISPYLCCCTHVWINRHGAQ